MQITKTSPHHLLLSINSACGNCQKTDQTLQKCRHCFFEVYCGAECQQTHWPKHRHICPLLTKSGMTREGLFWLTFAKVHEHEIVNWHARMKSTPQVTNTVYFDMLNVALGILKDCTHKRALDLGCGQGAISMELLQNGWHVTGIDNSKLAIQVTSGRAQKYIDSKQLQTVLTKVEEYDLPSQINLVVITEVLPYCNPSNLRLIFDKIFSSLEIGGCLVGSLFARGGKSEGKWQAEGAWFVNDDETVEKLLSSSSYDIIQCRRRPKPQNPIPSGVIEFCVKKKPYSYIQVVQDGAAVLIVGQTPREINFLHTNGIESCIVIMAKGEKGVAMIHDSGNLSVNSIKEILDKIGSIQFWATSANPTADEEYRNFNPQAYQEKYGNKTIYETKFGRILAIMTEVIGSNVMSNHKKPGDNQPYYPARNKWVFINSHGSIFTSENDELKLLKPVSNPSLKIRQKINELNCSVIESNFDCHLQFDGAKFTPIPRLLRPLEEIQRLTEHDVVDKILKSYLIEKQVSDNQEMKIRRKYQQKGKELPSADLALRHAANAGNCEDIEYLITVVGVDVDSQGSESKKTALHLAVEKKHTEAILMLLRYRARKDIPDKNGRTVLQMQ